MSTSQDTARSDGQQCAAPSRRRTSRPLRALAVGLLVAAGCYLAYSAGKLWADWRRVSQPVDVRQAAATDSVSPPIVLPLAGHWSFMESDWKLRSNIVNKNEVAARLDLLMAPAAHQTGDQLPDVSPEIMQLVEQLRLKPVERNGVRTYQFNRLGLQAQLVVRMVAGRPKAVSLAAAYPQQGDQWQFLALTPQGASDSASTTRPFLLPLSEGAMRMGGRFADDGHALLELITLNATANELLSTWKSAGWDVRSFDTGAANDFRYLCARGNELIYAWSADEPGAMHNLMLVRSPNNADTSP